MKHQKTYLFEEGIYHISSRAVARNLIFHNEESCNRFLSKIQKYLSPFCTIIHYAINTTEAQMIVKLNSRDTICEAFLAQKNRKNMEEFDIPPSSIIFSRAMSNLLVSTVKHFNYHHNRTGSLIAQRFRRSLITSKEELRKRMSKMDQMSTHSDQDKPWNEIPTGYRLRKMQRELANMKERCARYFYKRKLIKHSILSCFQRVEQLDLRGYFKNLPPLSIQDHFDRIHILIYLPKSKLDP